MYGKNIAIIVGNLGADPELRFTQSGKPVCNLRVAVNEPGFGDDGKDHVSWHSVTVWGKPGEAASKTLRNGSMVMVFGRTVTRSYDDKDGNKRYSTEVHADFIGSPIFGERDAADSRPRDDDRGQRDDERSQSEPRRDDRRQSGQSRQPEQRRDERGGEGRRPAWGR
jgi:single-strand DNA-binding protein